MPLYNYICSECRKQVDVLRTFDEYAVQPTIEEGGACNVDERRGATPHQWERRIHAPKITRGASWGPGSKGNWGGA